MAREHPEYRLNLELLNNRFPAYDMLNYKDVMEVTGMSINTVKKHFRFNSANKLSKVSLARWMCGKE
jgi:hypothetical protein